MIRTFHDFLHPNSHTANKFHDFSPKGGVIFANNDNPYWIFSKIPSFPTSVIIHSACIALVLDLATLIIKFYMWHLLMCIFVARRKIKIELVSSANPILYV